MTAMLTKIARKLAEEPVRAYLYGVGLPALVLLNGYGLLTDDKAALWGNLLGAVLIPAAEKARSRVSPVWGSTGADGRPRTGE